MAKLAVTVGAVTAALLVAAMEAAAMGVVTAVVRVAGIVAESQEVAVELGCISGSGRLCPVGMPDCEPVGTYTCTAPPQTSHATVST